jgi:hypothetical protein
MSAAPGRSQANSHRSPKGEGILMSTAGPFPRVNSAKRNMGLA